MWQEHEDDGYRTLNPSYWPAMFQFVFGGGGVGAFGTLPLKSRGGEGVVDVGVDRWIGSLYLPSFTIDYKPNGSARALRRFDLLDEAEQLNGGLMGKHDAWRSLNLSFDSNAVKTFLG